VRFGRLIALVVAAVTAAAACGGSTSKDTSALDALKLPDTVDVTSPAFVNGHPIPRSITCDGQGTPPEIRWSWKAVPSDATTVAVVVDDPGAPNGTFLHWLVVGLPPTAGSVPSHARGVNELDNTGGTRGWSPPCPPVGSTHRYRFTVYVLRDYVCADNGDAANGPDCAAPSSVEALGQIRDTAIAKGVLVGTYRR